MNLMNDSKRDTSTGCCATRSSQTCSLLLPCRGDDERATDDRQLEKLRLWKRCSNGSSSPPTGDDTTNKVEIDTVIAKELNALSKDDREKIFEEVHGIVSVVEEDPAFVSRCLATRDHELDQIQNLDRSQFDHAMTLRPDLRTNCKFCLQFLRSESFEPHLAARRMVRYFDSKSKLFGKDKLLKRITFVEGLTDDERELVRSGAIQVLGSKDQSGRRIIFLTTKLLWRWAWPKSSKTTLFL